MSEKDSVSFNDLNSFIDDQLTRNERARVLDVLKKDDDLSKSLCELQCNDEYVLISYSNIPEPKYNPYKAATKLKGRKYFAVAASILILLSASISWQLKSYMDGMPTSHIMELSQLEDVIPDDKKILIHISNMNEERIKSALDKTENLLNVKKEKIKIEVIANASGLAMLRQSSPYAERIKKIAGQFNNVKFKACGLAMHAAKVEEGADVELLPEAEKIPAALDEILKQLKENWIYFKA